MNIIFILYCYGYRHIIKYHNTRPSNTRSETTTKKSNIHNAINWYVFENENEKVENKQNSRISISLAFFTIVMWIIAQANYDFRLIDTHRYYVF
jgi:hypothetical protein